MEPGEFHALADDILPWAVPSLVGLRKHGVNAEGKTRKGVPDSYVGDSPATCRVAVEYTTKRTDQAKKVADDYDAIRRRCPSAMVIVLCTSRSLAGVDVSATETKASSDGVALEIIDGLRLAQYLNERQDLRFEYLSIPIGAHTLPSLVARGRKLLQTRIARNLPDHALKNFLPRVRASRLLAERVREKPGTTLLVGPAGIGKSTWSAAEATRYAAGRFVMWSPAKRLPLGDPDPIGIQLCQTAYGAADPARIVELADLLQRERSDACVFVDGVDEVHDFSLVDRALQSFRESALGAVTHLVLICRSGAVVELENSLGASIVERRGRGQARVSLEGVSRDEADLLLSKSGATPEEVRALLNWLPSDFRGTPLFLLTALHARRSEHLPATVGDIVPVLADHFVREITQRLKHDGRGPSADTVSTFLQGVALAAFKSPHQLVRANSLSAVPSGDMVGEGSLTARAVQCGLLSRSDADIGFAHPLFLEYFAARALEVASGTWETRLDSLRPTSSYRFVSKLAKGMNDPQDFIRAVLCVDGVAACESAGQVAVALPAELSVELVKVPQRLLGSRFPSDRIRALRLLAGLRSDAATRCAVEWWSNASAPERSLMTGAAADAFLTLQLTSECALIMNHYELQQTAGMPWYEPAFVRRLESLPTEFAKALRDEAFQTLERGVTGEALMLLSVLRDERLLAWLAAEASQRSLSIEEHRALIHLNTVESIDVFATSAEGHLAAMALLEGRADAEAKEQRSAHDNAIVIRMSDIGMHPHEHMLPLITAALESPRRDHVSFGMRWADLLPDPSLVSAYSAAHSHVSFPATARLVEHILEVFPMSRIELLFGSVDENARKLIVHNMFHVSDPDAEPFLVGLLDDSIFRADAIHSLGKIYAFGAGPAVARHIGDPSWRVRSICLETIGRLRYAPILNRLLRELSAVLTKQLPAQRTVEDRDFEYVTLKALSKIGGDDALMWLVEHMTHLAHPDDGVTALLSFGNPGVNQLRGLVNDGILTAEIVADAFARRSARLLFVRGGRPWIRDTLLFERVLEVERLRAGQNPSAHRAYLALAEFDLPEATALLVQLATDPSASKYNVDEAKLLLVYMGVEPFASESLSADIDRLQNQAHVWEDDLRRVGEGRREPMRQMLLERLQHGRVTAGLLSAFQWCCTPGDRHIFERYETDPRLEVADIAHLYLAGETAY